MQDLIVSPQLTIPAEELEVSFARSSGPGGQNVNKVNSKVRLAWSVRDNPLILTAWKQRVLDTYRTRIATDGRISVVSQLYRDQGRNLDDALEKLRQLLLACQYAPKQRRPTKPTKGSKMRRLEGKRQMSDKKRLRSRPDDG